MAIIISTLPPLRGFVLFQGQDPVLLAPKTQAALPAKAFPEASPKYFYIKMNRLYCVATTTHLCFEMTPRSTTPCTGDGAAIAGKSGISSGSKETTEIIKWKEGLCDTGSQHHGLGHCVPEDTDTSLIPYFLSRITSDGLCLEGREERLAGRS